MAGPPVGTIAFVELTGGTVRQDGVTVAGGFDVVAWDAAFEHQARGLGHGERITDAPVGAAVDNNAFFAVLPDHVDHAFVAHLGLGVDGEGGPKTAVEAFLDRLFIVVVDDHGTGFEAVFVRQRTGCKSVFIWRSNQKT